jgi:hypothetical protein
MKTKTTSIFIFLIIVLLYLDIPLFVGSFMLPSFTGIIFLLFFSVLYPPQVHQIKCFLALEGLFLGYLAFGVAGYDIASFISSQQLVVGVMLFSYLIIYTRRISDNTFSNVLAFTIIFIAFLSQLELYTVFREVSDSFRYWAYGDTSYFYENDNRDLALIGNIRPKVFAPEPSTHTILLGYLLVCYKLIIVKSAKTVEALMLILCTLVYFSTQSPTLLLSITIVVFLNVNWLKNLPLKIIGLLLLTIILLLVFFLLLEGLGSIQLGAFSRLSKFGDLAVVSSENVRLYYPLLTLADSIKHYPLFGIGVGNKEALVPISSILTGTNHSNLLNENMLLGSFAIPRIFIYFGFLGGATFLLIIYKTIVNLNAWQFLKLSVPVLVLVLSLGTFEGVYFWFVLAIGYRSCLGNEKHH